MTIQQRGGHGIDVQNAMTLSHRFRRRSNHDSIRTRPAPMPWT